MRPTGATTPGDAGARGDRLIVTLRLGGALDGLPAETVVVVEVARTGAALRNLGLEVETEEA